MDPKTYYLEVSCSNEWFDGAPECAKVTITPELAQRILSLSRLVRENGLYCVVEWSYLPVYGFMSDDSMEALPSESNWNECEEFRTECDRMIVSSDAVRFESYPKHADNTELGTEHLDIKNLAQDFALPWKEEV